MARKRPGTITIFEGRKGRGSRRTGRVRSFRRSGKFTASFEPDAKWEVNIDSRDLLAIVGTEIFRHLKSSIAADRDPETGAAHPKTLSTRKGRGGKNTTRDRDVDTVAMSKALRRTVVDHRWTPERHGGGWVRSPAKTRMIFYFVASEEPYSKWNAINKADSTRRGKGRIIWLGVGGQTAKLIRPALKLWTDRALEGLVFAPDSVTKANQGL